MDKKKKKIVLICMSDYPGEITTATNVFVDLPRGSQRLLLCVLVFCICVGELT